MKIGEILELTKEKKMADIAKEHLNIGEKPTREAMKKAGCIYQPGKKGWLFEGDQETLEKSIYDFSPTKPTAKETTNTESKVSSKVTNNETNNELNQVTNNVHTIVRKRFSVDLNSELIKQLKIKSVVEDRHIYELVEDALNDFLKK